MKRTLLILIVIAIAGGGGWYWYDKERHEGPEGGGKSAEAKPAEGKGGDEKPADEGSRVSHDEDGRVVIKMDDETQGNIGLLVEKPENGQLSPEVKGYGKVIDPGTLAGLLSDFTLAQATLQGSARELERVKLLQSQGNASDRVLQAAEVTVTHDRLAVQVAQEHLVLAWGPDIAARKDLAEFSQAFTQRKAALVRIDLPVGETISGTPSSARIFKISGTSAGAEYLGPALTMDAQTLGQGSMFIVKANSLNLVPGESVIGYLKVPGDPLTGVFLASNSVIRTEGAGWVYILNSGGDQFTRTRVALDHPTATGWFVTSGVTTNDYVVTSGAQVLLSEELKASLKPD